MPGWLNGAPWFKRLTVRWWLAAGFSVAVFLLALVVLHRALGRIDVAQVLAAARGYAPQTLSGALLLALASYLALGGFDWLGLHHVRRPLPVASTLLISFVSHAVSHNAGFAVLTGGSVRLRMYSTFGLGVAEVGGVVAFAGLSFALGIGVLASVAFILEGTRLAPLLHLPPKLVVWMGWAGLGLLLAYVSWTALATRPLAIGRWRLATPSLPLALGQVTVAATDLALVAGALYLLLPMEGTGISYPAFIGIYVVATTAGTLSHVPGGLGVFEGALTLLVPAAATDILAALLVFRVFYNLIPLVLAALVLAVFEGVQRYRHTTPPAWVGGLAPLLAGVLALVCALLVLLPAVPGVEPYWLSETARLLSGGVAGVLLALPWGLSQQSARIYQLAVASFAAAAVLALVRGPDWLVAAVSAFCVAALAAATPLFEANDPPHPAIPWPWAGAAAAMLAATAWLTWRADGHAHGLEVTAMATLSFLTALLTLAREGRLTPVKCNGGGGKDN